MTDRVGNKSYDEYQQDGQNGLRAEVHDASLAAPAVRFVRIGTFSLPSPARSTGPAKLRGVIDLVQLRNNPDVFKASQRARGGSVELIDDVLSADSARRQSLTAFEEARAQQKAFGKKVSQEKDPEAKQALVAEAKQLAERVKSLEADASEAEQAFTAAVQKVPNLIIDGVPSGGEEDSVEIRRKGTPRDFAAEGFEPKDHLEIGEGLSAIDTGRGAKVSGSRFHYLTGFGARLEMALLNLAMDTAIEAGFTPVVTPTLVRPEIMSGTGFMGEHADEIYFLERDDLYLVGTSEVALAGYYKDEIIDLSDGPIRMGGISSCYRREAGSYGKDTRGIIRVHQFDKVEMFVYCKPEEATEVHQELLAMEREMLAAIEVPYRVIDVAGGDLGSSAARKFDTEAWVPTQQTYRELTSTSNCTTFQARRLKTRYRDADGKAQTAATLNGTLATTRWLVAILENHQQADGSVVVPKALRPFVGKDILKPNESGA